MKDRNINLPIKKWVPGAKGIKLLKITRKIT